MNYRSYAIYNARTSGYSEMGELFAQKAVAAFSGELPFPETLDNWPVEDEKAGFELHTAYNQLIDQLKNDASDNTPELAAEAQAKFDCWLSSTASNQMDTAKECHTRFEKAMATLRDCENGTVVKKTPQSNIAHAKRPVDTAYPETRRMSSMRQGANAREGVIVVNNVNIPEYLINPVPVQPMVFNQNIYGNGKMCNGEDCGEMATLGEENVSRDEFINMMMALRSELAAINARLDKIESTSGERTMIKVQQIPLEPKQHVMEEIFEVQFDFNKSNIKPEYEALIRKLAAATQENKNIKVSIVGHTDTVGSDAYNYALGGKRAEAVQKMLVKYGIPSSQIVSVSAGKKDNKIPTGDQVKKAENRRVQVIKETHYTENPGVAPFAVEVEEYTEGACNEYGCEELY
jgi:outer membrane protein OmpA-like peptidoglycan-associated protein